ncbi:Neutral protease 2-like protein MEP8 [Bienertia sinuspersici]
MRSLRGMQISICSENSNRAKEPDHLAVALALKVRTRDKPTIKRSSSGSSSSSQTRTGTSVPSSSQTSPPSQAIEQDNVNELPDNCARSDELGFDQTKDESADDLKTGISDSETHAHGLSADNGTASSQPPPPPPIPPPKPSGSNSNSNSIVRRFVSDSPRIPARTSASASASRPSSPRSHGESEGYNSADEQTPSFGSSYYDLFGLWSIVQDLTFSGLDLEY